MFPLQEMTCPYLPFTFLWGVCVCPFLTDYKSTLFMIDTESFSVMWIANLFSQSVGDCLSLCGVFCYLKVFNYY